MPSEYTTPVLDFVALAADQFPHQTHQYRDQQHQQQQHQQQLQSSPSTVSLSVPMSIPIPMSPLLPLSMTLGSAAAPTTSQQAQAKMCAICHCALIPETVEIVDVQGVRNVVCTSCFAGEMMFHQYHRRQQQQQQQHLHHQQQQQQQHQTEESQSSASQLPSSAPMALQGPSSPQFPSPIVIPSISSGQIVTPSSPVTQPTQLATMVESQYVTLSHSPVPQTIGSIPVHRSPPMPIGENVLGEEGRDDSEHVDLPSQEDYGMEFYSTSTVESESCDENVAMLDEREVQDSLGLASVSISASDLNSSSGSTSTSMSEGVGQGATQSLLNQSGSFHSPSALPQPLPQQPSSCPAVLPPSQIQVKGETIEPLAQTAHDPSSLPSSSSIAISSSHPTNSLVASSLASQPPNSRKMKLLEPDPMTDISRLRVRSHTQDCLYPGAQFCGTQKSGKSSYDVSVTIVDVDFQSSFLCGYLHIRDLTDDWPELTTYFDAQIIGSRHGFLTQDWGATEDEDVRHWGRFPAYERVKPLIWGPKMNIPDDAGLSSLGGKVDSSHSKGSASEPRSSAPVYGPGNGGCVFMRWKERFLVPDHRVRDINGASFAGFYYVCVEFNPARSNASLKRRRKKVDRKSSSNHAARDTNVNIVRESQGESQQIRDQPILPPTLSSNANAKPPDTDVEMDGVEDPTNVRRERRFVGMEMDMDMGGDVDGFLPSRSRSLIRGANTANPSHSRSHTRRRRRREEQQYERYREDAFGNTTSATVTSRRDIPQHPNSRSLPHSMSAVGGPDDNCDDTTSLPYREWERVMGREREREREREYNHERRRGRMTERQSRSEMQHDQNSFPFSQSAAQSQIHAHTRTVVEPESEDSGSEYEYEYEYDENVYSDDPAYDDTLGSTPGGPYTATMSGYYFHQHSEPYQQLSLRYVPRRSTGSFEFR